MPEPDGFGIVRRLRRDGSQVPVIFLTDRDTQEDKVAALTLGGDDYLTKPFGLAELAARVQTVLRRTRPGGVAGPVLTFEVAATYVAYLRGKLARHGPEVIHTQRGVGYVLRRPRPSDPEGPDED